MLLARLRQPLFSVFSAPWPHGLASRASRGFPRRAPVDWGFRERVRSAFQRRFGASSSRTRPVASRSARSLCRSYASPFEGTWHVPPGRRQHLAQAKHVHSPIKRVFPLPLSGSAVVVSPRTNR
jgi:hypothetical protein